VRLEPITARTWRAAGALRLAPGQLAMVAEYEPVAFVILARTYIGYEGGDWHPLMAVDTEPVGVLALVDEGATWALRSFMIDARFQGTGHGRAAVLAAIDYVRARGGAALRLTVHPANAAAIRLYESLGFTRAEPRGTDLGMRLAL
jgi:ribosomal protein S18 acetylase RimI-like enzyme